MSEFAMTDELWWILAFVCLTFLGRVADIIAGRYQRAKLLKQIKEERQLLKKWRREDG